MRGLTLSKQFYEEIGRPALLRALEQEGLRADIFWAAGLVGEGSDCFGFDDAVSRDHDWGPGFCIWLTDEQFDLYGSLLQAAYDRLPASYCGYQRRESALAGKRVGVFRIREFYKRFLGTSDIDALTSLQWLYLPQQYLAVAVNGEVFEDADGTFSAIRRRLLQGYPEDVKKKKLAAALAKMAREGQYNLPRCLKRGDGVAAFLAGAEFADQAMQAIYLLKNRYAPYYKWAFRGLRELEGCGELAQLIKEFAGSLSAQGAEAIAQAMVGELQKEGLTTSESGFLQDHAVLILEGIGDPLLRNRHLLEG